MNQDKIQVQKDEENDKQPKILKQFVIVKEYNGSFSPTKKCKREYTQKCILKEKLSKSERNSLENYFDKEFKKHVITSCGTEEKEIKNKKYVTLIDLPDQERGDQIVQIKNDTPTKLGVSDVLSEIETSKPVSKIKDTMGFAHSRYLSPVRLFSELNYIEDLNTVESLCCAAERDTPTLVLQSDSKGHAVPLKPLQATPYNTDTIKKNFLYTLLAAGGLFGAYTLLKTNSD